MFPARIGSDIREYCGEDFLRVTPGIRLAEDARRRSKKSHYPSKWQKNWALPHIVVGRSITGAANPVAAYERSYMNGRERMKQKIAKKLLDIEAVFLNPTEPFTWSSGIKSPIYCDNRLTLSYPSVRKQSLQDLSEHDP